MRALIASNGALAEEMHPWQRSFRPAQGKGGQLRKALVDASGSEASAEREKEEIPISRSAELANRDPR